jgi:hypothetical protein
MRRAGGLRGRGARRMRGGRDLSRDVWGHSKCYTKCYVCWSDDIGCYVE